MTTSLTDPPSQWQRTTTRRFLRWLFRWRNVRRGLMGVVILVTAYALYCTEEDIRGKHSWQEYRRDLEAQGEQLDYKAFIPKPVPDDQNFAATPLIKSWFVRSKDGYSTPEYWRNDNYGRVSDTISSSNSKKDGGNRHFTDLVAWKTAFDV